MRSLTLTGSFAWDSWRPATCLPADCFCEAIRDGVVRQPANTWSSLSFVLVAMWVIGRHLRRPGSARSALNPGETWLFVGSLLLLGVGSAFYHASLTFLGQVVDVAGMYLLATFILLHRLGGRLGLSPILGVLGFVGLNAILMAAQITTPSLRRFVFVVLLVTAVIVEWRSSRAGRLWLVTGALVMVGAGLIWALDRMRVLCSPHSFFQGHAIWHILAAFAAACLYLGYEKEAASSTN